jgi:hypothetical protein
MEGPTIVSGEVRLRYFLGIDPGGMGGLAALSSSGGVWLLPLKDLEDTRVWEWLNLFRSPEGGFSCRAAMEQVGGFIPGREGMKHGGQPGHQMFKFGRSYGFLQGLLTATGIAYETVIPRTWQKSFGVEPRARKGGETQGQFKGRLKELAQSLYPSVKMTLQTCDALLLAEYCRKKESDNETESLALSDAL